MNQKRKNTWTGLGGVLCCAIFLMLASITLFPIILLIGNMLLVLLSVLAFFTILSVVWKFFTKPRTTNRGG